MNTRLTFNKEDDSNSRHSQKKGIRNCFGYFFDNLCERKKENFCFREKGTENKRDFLNDPFSRLLSFFSLSLNDGKMSFILKNIDFHGLILWRIAVEYTQRGGGLQLFRSGVS